MIPHEQYPPPKKPENNKITFIDCVMIAMTSLGIYSAVAVASVFNFFLVVIAWRMYERYRSNDL